MSNPYPDYGSSTEEDDEEDEEKVVVHPPNVVNVVNVVATFDLGVSVDPQKLVDAYSFAYWSPRSFPSVNFHTYPPRTSALVFATGIVVVVGCTSIWSARLCSDFYAELVRDAGYPKAATNKFTVTNTTATVQYPFFLDVEKFQAANPEKDSKRRRYVPTYFPGVISPKDAQKCTHTEFPGSCNITGTKNPEDLLKSFASSYREYERFGLRSDSEEAKVAAERMKRSRKRGLDKRERCRVDAIVEAMERSEHVPSSDDDDDAADDEEDDRVVVADEDVDGMYE